MIIRPRPLKKNDTIAIVATARKVSFEEVESAIKTFESWGLSVVLGKHLFEADRQFAGEDRKRLSDLQEMIDNPEVNAIICARGGYGTTRIIDEVNFLSFTKSPKWIIGFSDITVLLYHLFGLGYESVHGIMAGLFHKEGVSESVNSLQELLFGAPVKLIAGANRLNRPGVASGVVLGGNLSIVNNIIGTASDVDMKGKILFLEDLDEYLYHIDRMMVHLKRTGKLKDLAGLIIGDMSDMNDNAIPFGKSAYEIIAEHVEEFDYPVGFGFPIGHEAINIAIPCGRDAQITVNDSGSKVEFKG